MKLKKIPLLFLLIVSCLVNASITCSAQTAKSIPLNTVSKPTGITIVGNRLFVTQKDAILAFNLFTGAPSGSIGKKGEGPREYNFPPRLRFLQGKLVVLAANKILLYEEQGQYISEMILPGHGGFFLPLKEGFIGRRNIQEEKGGRYFQEISLYSSNLTPQKQLYKALMPDMLRLQPGNDGKSDYPVIHDYIQYEADDQNVIIGDSSKGCFFMLFDHLGVKISELNLPYHKIVISALQKKEYIAQKTSLPWLKDLKDRLNFTFPDNFPAFRYFTLSDQTLYVMTYEENSDLCRWEMIPLPQNRSRSIWLPKMLFTDSELPLVTFFQNDCYFLAEDLETEQWVLRKHPLD